MTADNPCDPQAYEGKTCFDQGCGDQYLYYDDKCLNLFFLYAWVERGSSVWKR